MARNRKNGYVERELRRRKMENKQRFIRKLSTVVQSFLIVAISEALMLALALM